MTDRKLLVRAPDLNVKGDTPLALWVVMAKPEAVMRVVYNVQAGKGRGWGAPKQGSLRNTQSSVSGCQQADSRFLGDG